jgi:hypothetical protein
MFASVPFESKLDPKPKSVDYAEKIHSTAPTARILGHPIATAAALGYFWAKYSEA